jgi:hypothetical protein
VVVGGKAPNAHWDWGARRRHVRARPCLSSAGRAHPSRPRRAGWFGTCALLRPGVRPSGDESHAALQVATASVRLGAPCVAVAPRPRHVLNRGMRLAANDRLISHCNYLFQDSIRVVRYGWPAGLRELQDSRRGDGCVREEKTLISYYSSIPNCMGMR